MSSRKTRAPKNLPAVVEPAEPTSFRSDGSLTSADVRTYCEAESAKEGRYPFWLTEIEALAMLDEWERTHISNKNYKIINALMNELRRWVDE